MNKYKEIFRLKEMLEKENIPFILWISNQLSRYKNRVCSVVEHNYSYGHNQDRLEIMGLISDEETDDDVLGHLTARDVFERIYKHFKGNVK